MFIIKNMYIYKKAYQNKSIFAIIMNNLHVVCYVDELKYNQK